MPSRSKSSPKDSAANLGFEARLWLAADSRGVAETAEGNRSNYAGANPEDPDEPGGARQPKRSGDSPAYILQSKPGQPAAGSPKGQRGAAEQCKAKNVFWVPADACWSHLQASAKQPTIGKTVDDTMVAIERDNPRLKGVLPKDYARPGLDTARRDSALSPRAATPQSLSAAKDNQRLGELIELIATISLTAASEGEKTHRSVDLLGRVYDWSGATKTAAGSPKGERGGVHQFYTPSCVVRCLVEMLAPYKGRIYDPACGSGGSLPASRLCGVRFAEKDRAIAQGIVQSEKFVESQGGVAKSEVRSPKSEVRVSK
jgi:type I restriction enzyme M protein